jgi:hypothetical protein
MIFNIVWGSIWFVGCTLLAIFWRHIIEWFDKRRKRIKYYHTVKTEWNIKQAFRLTDITLAIGNVLFALMAFNSALYLYKHVSTIANLALSDILKTILNFYGQFLWPVFMFGAVGFFIYMLIKGANNDGRLLPLWVVNNAGQSLNIYIRGWFIGKVEPGKSIQNNYWGAHFNNYLIDAKDDNDNLLYSREFSRRDLVEIDGKVEISNL